MLWPVRLSGAALKPNVVILTLGLHTIGRYIPSRWFFLSLCLFSSLCFSAVNNIWLHPTLILIEWPYSTTCTHSAFALMVASPDSV